MDIKTLTIETTVTVMDTIQPMINKTLINR